LRRRNKGADASLRMTNLNELVAHSLFLRKDALLLVNQ
jgi:hypothetical protein